MSREEYIVSQLNLACIGLREVCDRLTCCPELKEKVIKLREEVLEEYEKQYNGWKEK